MIRAKDYGELPASGICAVVAILEDANKSAHINFGGKQPAVDI